MEPQRGLHINKKKEGRQTVRGLNTALFLLRCFELGMTTADVDRLTVGFIYDMIIEKDNDNYDWPVKATQADFDKF